MAGGAANFDDEDANLLTDINVTPLVDVVLVLLIVFMITVPTIVGSAPIKVNLPETSFSELAPAERLSLDFFLKRGATGELVLYLNDQKTDEEKIRTVLKGLQSLKDQPATMSADKDIPYGEVVRVMDLLNGMGLHKISLMTRHVSTAMDK
jgi:biopolymer transport protein ExbD